MNEKKTLNILNNKLVLSFLYLSNSTEAEANLYLIK